MSSSFPPDSNWPSESNASSDSPFARVSDPETVDAESIVTNDGDAPIVAKTVHGPRAWSAIAIVFVSLLVFVVTSAVMTVAAFLMVHGTLNAGLFSNPKAMEDVMSSRLGLFVMVVTPQFALVLPSVIAAYLSPIETRTRLGLVRGNWPAWTWIAAAAATPLVGLMSSLTVGQFMNESASLKMMTDVFRSHGQAGFLIPLALMIGATPAICEELLFRGYVQTRLVRSAGPAFGIVISSILFAVFHMDFVHVIAVLPLGFFLGWVSWRSASLFPAMMGHFVNNVISVVAVVYAPEDQADVLAVPAMMVSLSIITAGMFGMAVVIAASVIYGRPETVVGSETQSQQRQIAV